MVVMVMNLPRRRTVTALLGRVRHVDARVRTRRRRANGRDAADERRRRNLWCRRENRRRLRRRFVRRQAKQVLERVRPRRLELGRDVGQVLLVLDLPPNRSRRRAVTIDGVTVF